MNNFYLNQIKQQGKDQELFGVLRDYFNRPCQYKFDDEEITAFVYSNDNGEAILEVSLTKKGKLSKISSQLSNQETKALEKQIRQAVLDDNGDKIGQTVCFLDGTVETYYRCDHFQILPVPPHAPKSRTIANSPFLLQFSYPTSPSWRVDRMRRMEREQLYINLLTLFLHTNITTNPSEFALIWTYDHEDHHSEQLFQGYSYKDFSASIDAFTDTNGYHQNMAIPAQDYYTSMLAFRNVLIAGRLELRIPDNLCASFEKVRSLAETDRENFYRACHWLRQAQIQLSTSKSLSLIALVIAIECLIEKKRCPICQQERVSAIEHCEECGEPIYKITEAFKTFVERFLPEIDHYVKPLSLIYDTRSSLVHGSEVLLSDSRPWARFTENKRAFKEDSIYDQAYFLTKVMLYSWLHSS